MELLGSNQSRPRRPGAPWARALAGLGLALLGCAGADLAADPALQQRVLETEVSYSESGGVEHRLALGILALVNDPLTDEPFLSDRVLVERRAALRIVAHRQGGDGLDGTWDDDSFDRILELDEVAFVGPRTLELLGEAASRLDLVPVAEVEGVLFTEDQLAMTLALANFGSLYELDSEASLDVRAAQALVYGRPFDDLFAVGDRPYVGPSALTKLKFFAPRWIDSRGD